MMFLDWPFPTLGKSRIDVVHEISCWWGLYACQNPPPHHQHPIHHPRHIHHHKRSTLIQPSSCSMPAKLTKSNPHLLLQSRLNLIRISNMLSDLYGSTVQAEDKITESNSIKVIFIPLFKEGNSVSFMLKCI